MPPKDNWERSQEPEIQLGLRPRRNRVLGWEHRCRDKQIRVAQRLSSSAAMQLALARCEEAAPLRPPRPEQMCPQGCRAARPRLRCSAQSKHKPGPNECEY